MNLVYSLGVLTFVIFFLGMRLEESSKGRLYPEKPYWRLKGLFFLCLGAVITGPIPFVLKPWLGDGFFHFQNMNPVLGGVFGYFVFSFFGYGWHRATHTFSFLWRWTHQMHHAPVRVDLPGVGIMHPFESFLYGVIMTFVINGILGLSIESLSVSVFISQIYAFFGHINMKTPHFMGYIIQRPEAHVLHHQRRPVHCNFGDFPLWDILFGTYKNPPHFGDEETGFGGGRDEAYGPMLLGKLVSSVD